MSSSSDLLVQCLEMTNQLMKTRMKATIDIKIGNDFNYHFSNQEDNAFLQRKKLSPSQKKRNFDRKVHYEEQKTLETKINDIKIEPKALSKESQTQTEMEELIEKKENEAQTNAILYEIETLENALEVDKHGKIHPRESESLVEMKINHNVKDWNEIESHITDNLKLPLIGKPWISNNGRNFMTIGFRTKKKEFEYWKLRTFNWQESGVTAVTFSRLYR